MAKWYYRPGHPKANERGFVAEADMGIVPDQLAKDAPVMPGRFYENTKATDGTDIGSRWKHKEYMRQKGVTVTSDFTHEWYESERKKKELQEKKERREDVARAAWQVFEEKK